MQLLLQIMLFLLVASTARLAVAEPWLRHRIDDTSQGADGVRLQDVNGDGWDDIVTGWEEGGEIRVYLHPGKDQVRAPWPRVTVGKVRSPEDAVFVDLDRDGAIDVVSCCEGKNKTIYIHWAPSEANRYLQSDSWSTVPIEVTQQKQSWMFAVPAQVDGRFGPDLIVGSKGAKASVGWLESPPDPRRGRWRFHLIRDAGWVMSLRAADMDADQDWDLLVSDRKGPRRGIFWLEKHADNQGLKWIEHSVGGSDREVMFLDLNVAPRLTLLAAVRGGPLSEFTLKDGLWTVREVPLPSHCGTGKGVAFGDVDLDGHQDWVFSCENAVQGRSGVGWLRGPQFHFHEISGSAGVKFDRIELCDLDRDGDLDVLTCEERANLGVIWYENPHRN